jgi:hypothetical protein
MDVFHKYAIRHFKLTDNDRRSLNRDLHPSSLGNFRANQNTSAETSLRAKSLGEGLDFHKPFCNDSAKPSAFSSGAT